jgi:hypothetical protein
MVDTMVFFHGANILNDRVINREKCYGGHRLVGNKITGLHGLTSIRDADAE